MGMMKPKIDDVIEYVRAGEDDPKMGEMLRHNPDGQELLKQARFICKMLKKEFGEKDLDDFGQQLLGSAARSYVAESREVMREEFLSRTFYQSAPLPASRKQSPSIKQMIGSTGGEDLGTLALATGGERVALSYDPSAAALKRSGKLRSPKPAAAQMDFEGILIHGRGYTLSVPDAQAVDEPIRIRVTQDISNMPAKHLALIYMPDSGPFIRVGTDSDGRAELPMPELSGTLRIETGILHFLHIELKK